MPNGYFAHLYDERAKLQDLGLDHYPTESEIVDCLIELSEKLDLIAEQLGIHIDQDCFGNWVASQTKGGDM